MSLSQTTHSSVHIWPNGIGWLCLVLAAAFQTLCLTQPLDFLIDVIFDRDDAFYYFVIARNMAETGRASFDGLHPTNGVQFLWHYILVCVAHLVPEKVAFLRAVLGVCLALNIVAGILLWELGRRLRGVMLADIALIFWAGVMIERWDTFQGMEFSLHIVVILGILLVLWQIWQDPEVRPARMALLGALLTLNYWTRLDAVVFSIAVWILATVLVWHRSPPAKTGFASLFSMTAIPALGGAIYLWVSYTMGGTLLPLSGAVKGDYARAYFEDVGTGRVLIEQAGWWLKIQSLMLLALLPESVLHLSLVFGFNPMSEPMHLILPLVVFGLVGMGIFIGWCRFRDAPSFAPVFWGGALLWAVCAVHVAVMIYALGDFSHVTRHYYGWLLVFWLIWGALLVVSLMEALPKLAQGGLALVFVTGSASIYGAMGTQFLTTYQVDRENYSVIVKELAGDLSAGLPQDAVVGAWNAGRLGFFLDRSVVNLDGLVNDKSYRALLQADVPLQSYFERTGVTHLVDHNKTDLTLAYQEKRDREGFFRDGITWDEVRVLKQAGDIYVLEVKE